MPSRKFVWDPNHWRFRAEETRTVADQMTHEAARTIMRRIALDYDRLAKVAEEQLIRMKSLRRTDAGTSPDSRDGIFIKAGKTKVRTIPRHRTRTTLHRRQRTSISTSTRRTGYT